MKFELEVHGGFTGLRRTYSGELDLSAAELNLLNELSVSNPEEDSGFRDQESYNIILKGEPEPIRFHLTERQLTPVLRELLRKMKSTGN